MPNKFAMRSAIVRPKSPAPTMRVSGLVFEVLGDVGLFLGLFAGVCIKISSVMIV